MIILFELFATNESNEDEYRSGGKGGKKPNKQSNRQPKKTNKPLTDEYKLEEPYYFDISLNNHIIERINSFL